MDKFIVIDGLDGAGKDTQVKLLAEMYEKQGKNVVVRSHPSMDNKYGIKSKEALLKTGKINHLKATVYFGLDAIRSIRKYYNVPIGSSFDKRSINGHLITEIHESFCFVIAIYDRRFFIGAGESVMLCRECKDISLLFHSSKSILFFFCWK